ncbi:HAD-IA family hydrolase [Glaciecola sp. SC05]|uniref:HAD-IA family hydrolase n=1 Tax=Glaciecola sp. SC05 TaxID=1987355 RepID=UPI0035274DAF
MIVYKPIGEIRAITFDLDDTFYANWPYILEAEQHLRQHISEHYQQASIFTSADWFKFKKEALNEDPELRHDMGALRTVSLTKGFVKSGMPSEDIPTAVADCFDTFYHKRSDFEIEPDIHAALKVLASKVPLVAITNGNVNAQQIGIKPYFTHILQASKQRKMKPHCDMFDEAAQLLNLAPSNILHVGDNLEKDVWGATRAGYYSAWYAHDRKMNLNAESVCTLPHIQLDSIMSINKLLK